MTTDWPLFAVLYSQVSLICLIYLSLLNLCFYTIRSITMFLKVLNKVIFRVLPQTGFKLIFQSGIVRNTYKISLVFVLSQMCTMVGPTDRKCRNFACYGLLENAFSNVNVLIKSMLQSDFRMKNVFRMRKT